MSGPSSLPLERALILAPRGRDALVARDILNDARISTVVCRDLEDLLLQLRRGADLAIVTEETLRDDTRALAGWVGAQPPWSDLPILVLTRSGADSVVIGEAIASLGNVTLLERPLRIAGLVSVVRSALRARFRQYQIQVRGVGCASRRLGRLRLGSRRPGHPTDPESHRQDRHDRHASRRSPAGLQPRWATGGTIELGECLLPRAVQPRERGRIQFLGALA